MTAHTVNQIDSPNGNIAAIVGGVATVVVAFVVGLWKWMSGRKQSETDAQGSMVAGFVALLAEFKAEREQLVRRINELEAASHRQDQHIAKLERILVKHKIEIISENNE